MGWGPSCGFWWGPGAWFGGPFGMIVTLLFWALVIVAVVYLVRAVTRNVVGQPAGPKDAPLDILRRRYAAGEIGAEEFKRMRSELG